ncbi:hypothetical protein BDFB_015140, partial [Asbolus verrucosus]
MDQIHTQYPQKVNVWCGIIGQNIIGPFFINGNLTRQVRQYLDETFPGRWIGRRDAIEWPARSPDLTLHNFFLWGY